MTALGGVGRGRGVRWDRPGFRGAGPSRPDRAIADGQGGEDDCEPEPAPDHDQIFARRRCRAHVPRLVSHLRIRGAQPDRDAWPSLAARRHAHTGGGQLRPALPQRHGGLAGPLRACNAEIATEIPLDPRNNRTGDHWHIRVDGLPDEFCYGYRVDGPKGVGNRFDPSIVLIDPASRALSCGRFWGAAGSVPRRSLVNRVMVDDPDDINPCIPREDSIIYELHVRGFTVDPSSGVRHPGTYAGLIEKIPYLKELGVTAVELLPIDEFDENDCPFVNPLTGEKLKNFWGYNTIAYGAPKAAYASNPERSAPWEEFRRMVRAFHAAGIEVILDVVFNHTAEGSEIGPTYNFRGLDNQLYYLLDEKGRYLNFTGCGNTVNSNHPVVRNLLLSCLSNMVAEGDVDGFRFDLASVMGRDLNGEVLVKPPVIEMISEDALLSDAKMIAEPWDAAGLYQVGSFPGGQRWSVWNGRYRDDVRRFWRGEPGMISALATRLCGSDDLYHGRGPLHSINFITCHDGFTLNDLVSYNHKHNEANGEANRDGNDANMSWNCGVEGPTDDPAVLAHPQPPGAEPDRDLDGLAGRPHAPGRGRVPPDPAGEQQRLVPGQRDQLGRLDPGRAERRLPPLRPPVDRPADAPPRPAAADLLRPQRPDARHRLARLRPTPARLLAPRATPSPWPSTAAASTATA